MPQFLIAIDQLLNTIIKIGRDGYGYADEMLSARAWRLRDRSNLHIWINRLYFWDDNHCCECYQIEQERQQLPPEYRAKDAK
jgi:hypothetical protein